MKKIYCLILIVCSLNTARACEICGCGLGNYYIGLLPQFNHKFIGLRYQYRSFKTVLKDNPAQFSRDQYSTVELWGGWNIGKKWQLIAIIPYNYIHQVSDDGVTKNNGTGDIALMTNYKLFDKISTSTKGKKISQQVWVGAGVKAPTGKFDIDITDPAIVAIANTQTGSASTDFMLNAMYNVRVNKIGITNGLSYKINTANSDRYLFGNKLSANSFVSYNIQKTTTTIVPNAGILYETTTANKLEKQTISQTGGHLLSAAAGIEIGYKKITIGGNVQLPVTQNFSEDQTHLKVKLLLHVSYSF